MKARIQIHKRNGPAKRPVLPPPLVADPAWHEQQIREQFAAVRHHARRIGTALDALQKAAQILDMNWDVLIGSKDGKGKPCKR